MNDLFENLLIKKQKLKQNQILEVNYKYKSFFNIITSKNIRGKVIMSDISIMFEG